MVSRKFVFGPSRLEKSAEKEKKARISK